MKHFVEQKLAEHEHLQEIDENIRKHFWDFKCTWISLTEKHRSLLFEAETARLNHARDMSEFLCIFPEYIELTATTNEVEFLKRQGMLLKQNPGITLEELDECFEKQEQRSREGIEDMKHQVAMECGRRDYPAGGTISDAELNRYKEQVKDLLEAISLKTHEDTFLHAQGYQELTDLQKDDLRELWEESRRIKAEELKYSDQTVGRHLRSIDRLMEILTLADKILDHAGIEINVNNVIEGESITERAAWLEDRIAILQKRNGELRQEIQMLSSGPDIREKRAMRDSGDEIRDKISKQMWHKIDKLKNEALKLSQKIKNAFIQEAAC